VLVSKDNGTYSFCFVKLTDAPQLVVRGVLSTFIELCIWGITETDFQTVDQIIQTFNVSAEIVSIYSVEITVILNEILAISCPGQPMCSGRGNCSAGVCVCNAGNRFIV